jgi:hypothetical protein
MELLTAGAVEMTKQDQIQSIDHKKVFKDLYHPPKKPVILEIPAMHYLKIDGRGNPNDSEEFSEKTQLLYALSYAIRFDVKKHLKIAYTVMPLEGLWWAQDMDTFHTRDKAAWQWTLMILQPEFVTAEMVETGKAEVIRKKKLEQVREIRFEPYEAGTVVTMLHIGSYDDETPNIQWMHTYAKDQGYQLHGFHQEIYLSDPRKTTAEKMKTILRQPIRKA